MLGGPSIVQTRDDDVLVVRRGRSLALLLLLLMSFSLVLAIVTPLVSGNLAGLISSGIALLLFTVVYLVNRSGIAVAGDDDLAGGILCDTDQRRSIE